MACCAVVAATQAILHVDMDAFFASVEMRDDPSLRGKPVLVGGGGKRGVVAAASYEARKFGCHSAQPMAQALRRCPHAVVVAPKRGAYSDASRAVFEVFRRFSPLVEALSIDEAFIDVTGTHKLFGEPVEVAEAIRAEVRAQTQLTCSVGVSAVKFIAKIASTMHKPDGLTVVAPGTELDFLRPLPVGRLWGVGPKAQVALQAAGLKNVGDVMAWGEPALVKRFGNLGRHLHALAWAQDPRRVVPDRNAKQISHEDTYSEDLRGAAHVRERLLNQSFRVADRLVAHDVSCSVVHIKIRHADFKTFTRQRALKKPTRSGREIYSVAKALADELGIDAPIRLTGVSVSGLRWPSEPAQLDLLAGLDTEPEGDGEVLQSVLSAVRERYGTKALFPAAATGNERRGELGGVSERPVEADPDSDSTD